MYLKQASPFLAAARGQVAFGSPSSVNALLFPSNLTGSTQPSALAVIEFAAPGSDGLPPAGPSNAGWTMIRRIKPIQQTGYYAQFWYAQGDGSFTSSNFNVGVHPYPYDGSPGNDSTVHVWEIATNGGDFVDYLGSQDAASDGKIVTKGEWYLQALVVEYNGGSPKFTFYNELPSVANADKVIRTESAGYFSASIPTPKITIGDSPWATAWWEERASCHLGEIKIIAKALSESDLLSEAADMTQLVTSDAIANIWWGKKGFASVDDLTCDYGTSRSFTRNDTNNLITLGDALSGGSELPEWVAALSVGQWTEITSADISTVEPSPQPAGTTGYSAKINSWNSFVVDTRSSKVYLMCAGGHADYAGNEVDMIDLTAASPAWTQLLAPTAAANVVQNSLYYTDGRPSSRHIYYGVTLDETNDRIMLFGGCMYGDDGGSYLGVSSYNITANTFNASGTHPDAPSHFANSLGQGAVCNPLTGDMYVTGNYQVSKWTRSSNSWSTSVDAYAGPWGVYTMGAFDSTRGRILWVDDIGAFLLTVSDDSYSTPTISGAAASTVSDTQGGMVYVEAIDKFLCMMGGSGGPVQQIDPSTFEATTFTTSGGTSIAAGYNGVWNRFVYVPALQGCLYQPSYTGGLWFLRVH